MTCRWNTTRPQCARCSPTRARAGRRKSRTAQQRLARPDRRPDHLFALEPHRRGRIPVVLVHGTASSPFRWADMVNDLLEDKEIRDHYEFWFFAYNTGNPIPLSANVLRHSLEDAVKSLGGVQADPALGRMVVIGHSQGGLLTKMNVIDSGTKIWNTVSNRPLDDLKLKPETKVLLKESLFVHPLPFVETVIFIATPHGGSYHASLTIVGLFHEAGDAAGGCRRCCRRRGGQRGRCAEIAEGSAHLQQHQRHVARQSGDRGRAGDAGRAWHPCPLHHPDAAGRPAGGPRRRRRGVHERPHRRASSLNW